MINLDESISKILNTRASRQISTDFGMGIDLDKLMFLKSLKNQEIPYKSPKILTSSWTKNLFQNNHYNPDFSLSSKSLFPKTSLPLLKQNDLIFLKIKNLKEYQSSSKISSILTSENQIILGYSSGKLLIFSHSCRPLQELKSIKSNDAVISLELYSTETFLLSGHSSGQINLFDLSKNSLLKTLTIHYSPVTCLKYWKNSENFFFSGDSSGKCFLSQFEKASLKGKVNSFTLVSGEVGPVTSVEVSSKLNNCKFNTLVAVCGFKRVAVYSIEPKLELVFVLEMEEQLAQGSCPSCVWLLHSLKIFLLVIWETTLFLYEYFEQTSEFNEKISFDLHTALVKILTFEMKAVIVLAKEDLFCFKIENLVKLDGKVLRKMKIAKVSFQEIVKVDGLIRPTYDNLISFCRKGIFFISGLAVVRLSYLDWKSCLDQLKECKNWITCLALAIQFVKGKYQQVYLVDDAKTVGVKVNQLLLEYSSDTLVPLKYRIWNCVEICVALNDFDQLNVEIYEKVLTEGKEKALEGFIWTFEFFVRTGQLKSLSIVILARMADFYRERGKISTFESVLVHLNPLLLNQKIIKSLCLDLDMITAYIFISSSSPDVIFDDIFQNLIENLESRVDLNKKFFLFYQIFHFLTELIEKKLVDGSIVSDEYFFNAVSSIVVFLSKSKNLKVLMDLDPSSTLELLFLVHTKEELQRLFESDTIGASSLSDVIEMLLQTYPESNHNYLQICLFVVSLSCKKGQVISRDLQFAVVKYLLLHDSVLQTNQIFAFDVHDYASQISKVREKPLFGLFDLEGFDKIITKSIKKCSFSEEQRNQIFRLSSLLPYSRLIIYASELRKDYENCIFTFIRCPGLETQIKIFKWIRKIYNSLEDTRKFLSIIEKYIEDLGLIDAKSTYSLILQYFNKNFIEITKKLERAEDLQFLMLEKLKKKGLSEDLISTYTNYLSKFKKDQVLPFLKSLPSSTKMETLDSCIEICKIHKNIESICYLLRLQKKIFEALEIIYLELRSIMKNLSEVRHSEMKIIKEYVVKIYEICEGNLDDLQHHEAKGIFTSILEILIMVYEKLKGKFEEDFKNMMKMFVTAALHYVNFEFLIQKTAEKTKSLPMSIFKEALFELFTKRSIYLKNLRSFSSVLQEEIKVKTKKQVFLFKKGLNAQSICWICMSSLNTKQKVKVFQCQHGFHVNCLDSDRCFKCVKK